MYIDVHTHNPNELPDVLSIKNIRIGQPDLIKPDHGWFSVGIHPWDSNQPDLNRNDLLQQAKHPNVLAIGECGLDRLRGADLGAQVELFDFQARIAENLKKTLIIHCVQAWQELIALKKEIKPAVPWIIHGFRGKSALATQMIHQGFYLSFGEAILAADRTAANSLIAIPIDRLFLETDVSQVPINMVYQAAAEKKGLSLTDLQQQILQNFTLVFGTHVTPRMASTD